MPLKNGSALAQAPLWVLFAMAASSSTPAEEPGHGAHADRHGAHANHLSAFLGGTDHDGHTEFTFGLDYERRIDQRLGVGFVAEHAGGEIDATTLLGVVDIHFGRGWAVQTGPGIEFIEAHGETEREFVCRLGLLYELQVDGFTVAPQAHYDWTPAENSVVFGIAIGRGY
jgi:hypothetical protein